MTSLGAGGELDLDSLDQWAFEVGNEPVLALIQRLRKLERVREAAAVFEAVGATDRQIDWQRSLAGLRAALFALDKK